MKLWKKCLIGVLLAGNLATCVAFTILVMESWGNPQGEVLMAFNYVGERLSETIAIPLWSFGGLALSIWLIWNDKKHEKINS